MSRPHRPDRVRSRARLAVDRLEGRALMAFAGALDPTFGGTGYFESAVAPKATTGLNGIQAVATEPDGSVVAAGLAGKGSSQTIGLIHLSASGSLDTTFGVGGEADVTLPPGATVDTLTTLLVQPNGQIIVVGTFDPSGSTTSSTIVERFNENGTPDSTFGTDGVLTLGAAGTAIGGATVEYGALDSEGRIVLAGSVPVGQGQAVHTEIALARLGTDGQLDTSFGTDGLAMITGLTSSEASGNTIPVAEDAYGVAIQPNGQIVVLGVFHSDFFGVIAGNTEVLRANSDGSQDTSFLPNIGGGYPAPGGIAVRPDGEILVATTANPYYGGMGVPTPVPSQLLGLNASGSIEQTATFPAASDLASSTSFNTPTAFALEPDGDVLLATDSSTIPGIVRLAPDLTLDLTFGDDGFEAVPVPAATNQTVVGSSLAIAPGGQIILGATAGTSTQATLNVVARLTGTATSAQPGDFTGDGISDPALYLTGPGEFVVGNSSGGPGQFVQLGIPGTGNSIPIPGDYYGTGQEDLAVFLPTLGTWAIKDPTGQTPGISFPFGSAGIGQTIPVPANYSGTGIDDVGVFLTQTATWDILNPGLKPGIIFPFGSAGVGNTIPVPGDYYGTGSDDVAVYLPQIGTWDILAPGLKPGFTLQFGIPGIGNSIPVPGDYDDSGHTELAVYIPSAAELQYINKSGAVVTEHFGLTGAGQTLPEPGDYDGSGKTEVAAYFPSTGDFVYRTAGGDVAFAVGFAGDGPIVPVTQVAPATLLAPPVIMPFDSATAAAESVMGEADALDFVMPLASAKQAKPGDPPTP